MVVRHGVLVCAIFALFTVLSAGAIAQSPFVPGGAPAASPAPAPAAAKPAAPQVNMAAIAKKANDATDLNIDAKIKSWRNGLDRIERGIHAAKGDYKALKAYRAELVTLRTDADEFWKKLEPVLNSANDDVQALPAAPAQDQAPEPEQAAIYRAEVKAYFDYLNSARGSLDNAKGRVDKLIDQIAKAHQSRVADILLKRTPGAFSTGTWRDAPGQIMELPAKVFNATKDWWQDQDQDQILPLIGVALALWLSLTVLNRFGVRWLRRWPEGSEPPFWQRAADAAGIILLRSMPVVLPLIFFYNAIDREPPQALPELIAPLFYSAARSLIVLVAINALISTALSPSDHRWRLISASNGAAVRVSTLLVTVAIVYAAATFLLTAAYQFKAPDSARLALILVPDAAIVLLVAIVLQMPLGRGETAEGLPSTFWLRALRLLVWLLVIATLAAGAAGYISLAQFITRQLVVTGAILMIVYLLLLWADGVAQAMASESSGIGKWLSAVAKLDQGSRQRLAVPVSLLLKLAVLLAAVPLILNQWNYQWPDIFELYRQLVFGFRIGNTTVSLAALLASLVVFILGYFAAKFFQQWLDNQILKPAGLSGGLRDSIRTGVGYIGVFAAALFALSYAGFSLSNFAIVAGAFSVGIGFGLQSVVNNFVSGLILLAERPIKVGDLVVVGGEEGYVRKISVRSTEIETFDRANVLIPNSFFVSEKVKNWTLRNNTGRVTIAVSVAHGNDPRAVKAILLQAAHAHPSVMRTPEAFVDFEDFGAGTLNFKLYAFIWDLDKSVSTRTDLRIAILDAFNAAGIVMPSHETDVTMRDIDWLRDAVKLYMAKATDGHPAKNGQEAHAEAADPAE